MVKSSKLKSSKKRVRVKDLGATETKLTGKDMKKVKGGVAQVGPAVGTSATSTPNPDTTQFKNTKY